MALYVLRRLAALVPLLLAVSLALFAMLHAGRGDPALDYLRLSQIPPTDAAVVQARADLGLDRPLPVQYLSWLAGAVRLDFGRSWVTQRPVLEDLATFLPATLELAGAALLLTILLGVPLGVLAALARDRWPDHLTRVMAFLGVSMPNFWLAYLLMILFAVTLDWLPATGRGGLAHLAMPALATAAMSIAIMTRLVRSAVLGQLANRHLVFARARGLSERTIIARHVVLNALVPPVTAIGLHIGELLGGAMVVEMVFAWPGIGRYALQAISNRDFPALQGFVVALTLVFVLSNLAVDIACAWLDPRIRLAPQS
jgi:nickel transport system permease protein